MYGLINRSIEGLITARYGADRWQAVRARAGLADEPFVSMRSYDDSVTYALVGAASAELEVPAEALLEAFGQHWTVHVAHASYGDMLQHYGETLPEFIGNLDAMHAQVAAAMPALVPPSFRVNEREDGVLVVEYRSTRAGLAPMVVGLLQGLCVVFRTDHTVRLVRARSAADEPDIFELRPGA